MVYAFKLSEHTSRQVRKIAKSQIDLALGEAASEGFAEAVHDVRRRCKKVRGLLRLVRPNFAGFSEENAAFREIASALSQSRDAAVMVETLDLVAKDYHLVDRAQPFRARLVDELEHQAETTTPSELLKQASRRLKSARRRADGWTFEGKGFELIAPGLLDTYARMRRSMGAAAEEGSAEAFHEWRKDAKNHWYHTSLLARAAPDLLEPREKALDELGEALGDHHNLAVLAEWMEKAGGHAEQPLEKAIAAAQHKLADRAFALGRQLAAEKPKALVRRIEAFWSLLPEEG